MSIFAEIRNERLIRELQRELNTDVLLFGFDGFTYFGNMQQIEDCRIALLTPAIKAECNDVEILSPGGDVRHVEFVRVDLWQIVGKGTGIVNDPIQDSCSNSSSTDSVNTGSGSNTDGNTGSGNSGGGKGGKRGSNNLNEVTDRQESHHLIRILCRMIGDDVAVTTLGGFLFTGTLGDVDDELAIMTVDEVFLPGTSSAISSGDVRSVVINLEAITSVSSFTCC